MALLVLVPHFVSLAAVAAAWWMPVWGGYKQLGPACGGPKVSSTQQRVLDTLGHSTFPTRAGTRRRAAVTVATAAPGTTLGGGRRLATSSSATGSGSPAGSV